MIINHPQQPKPIKRCLRGIRRCGSKQAPMCALAMLLLGCTRTPEPVVAKTEPPPPPPTCLVLSVGAEKGLAHIGVISALSEKGVSIDCVIGTSMGSLVGALYASSPESDVGDRYRELFQAYIAKTQAEATERGVIGFLLGVLVVAASGGTAAPALAAGAGAGAVGAATTKERDLDRLRETMDEYFASVRIEELPLEYRTIHQRVGETGISEVPIRGGNLASEVSLSVANPLIFPGIKLKSGTRIDPGADSVAAIPLEYACREFPDHQFIVSNVTDGEIFTTKEMKCPYQEVRPQSVSVNRDRAIIGQEPDFTRLIQSGYSAAQALRYDELPRSPKPRQKQSKVPREGPPPEQNDPGGSIRL